MIDDLLSLKAAIIERCVNLAREKYSRAPGAFAADQPAQDAAILIIQRACQATLDTGQHLIQMRTPRSPEKHPQSTYDRAHTRPPPRLDAKRPEFRLPRSTREFVALCHKPF